MIDRINIIVMLLARWIRQHQQLNAEFGLLCGVMVFNDYCLCCANANNYLLSVLLQIRPRCALSVALSEQWIDSTAVEFLTEPSHVVRGYVVAP